MASVPASDRARRRRAGWCGLLPLLLASLAGCTSLLNPYIDAKRETITYAETDHFPELRKAAGNADKVRKQALEYRDQHVITRSLLSYGVFGAAAAGGIAALYGAHRDVVLGLGLGAAGGFSYGELFVGADKIAVYSAAGRALYCVVAAADAVSATGKTLAILTAKPDGEDDPGGVYWQQNAELEALLSLDWGEKYPQVVKEAKQARTEYAAAIVNLNTFTALDNDFATAANQTAAMILEAMEQKLSAIQPDLAAVLRAAEGIGGVGVAYVKRVTPPEVEPTTAEALPPGDEEKIKLAFATTQVKQAAVKINERITGATNRMGQVGTACVLNLPTAAILSISQTNVTLGKGQTVTLVARGGKLPLTSVWQGTAPSSKQIEVVMSSGREIFLFGKEALPPGEFTLLIRDSLAAPGEVEVKINSATAKLAAKPDKVTVKAAGSAKNVVLSGGKKPYTYSWVVAAGGHAPDKITVEVANGTVKLTGKEGLKTGDHSLLLSDSATPPQTVIVKVKAEE